MRRIVATLLASSLFAATASADTAPLTPGKPAGVKQADIEAGGVLLWIGVLGLAAGIAVLANDHQGKGNSSSTTTQ